MWRIRNISTFGITATLRNAQLPKRAAGHAHLRPRVYLVAFDFWPPLMGCVFGAQLINCHRIDFFHFYFFASARFGFGPSSKRANRKTHPLKTAPSEGHRFVICENYHCIKNLKREKRWNIKPIAKQLWWHIIPDARNQANVKFQHIKKPPQLHAH